MYIWLTYGAIRPRYDRTISEHGGEIDKIKWLPREEVSDVQKKNL